MDMDLIAQTEDETPEKKLLRKGPAGLSDAELLSIVLRPGATRQSSPSSVELAERVLDFYRGSLAEIARMPASVLRMTAGLGEAKAVVLAAVMELGKRRKYQEALDIDVITSKNDVIAMFKPMLAELPYEEFWALFLGASNKVIDRIRISKGGTSATLVDNRLIIKRALDKLAASVIIVHNHPSGKPEPSPQDIELTKKLADATAVLEIHLMDHIIITYGESYSFKANGLL